MSTMDVPGNHLGEQEALRDQWLERLSALVKTVREWAEELGWATRQIEKKLEDSQVGDYKAPALIIQEGTTRVLLEPIARSAPGVEGVVDFYLMPAYDDIATLFYCDGGWQLYYSFAGSTAVANAHEAGREPLSRESFRAVLEEITSNAT